QGGVEGEGGGDRVAGTGRDGEGRSVVAEWLQGAAGVNALNAADLAPRDLPRPPTSGYVVQYVFEDGDFRIRIVPGNRLRLRLKRRVKPQREDGHRDRINRADAIPRFQRGDGFGGLIGARGVLSFQLLPFGDERRDLCFGFYPAPGERGLLPIVAREVRLFAAQPA